MAKNPGIKLVDNGKRIDGRALDQVRDITIDSNVISVSDGSAKVAFGNTVALASVYGPRELFPRFMQKSDTGILRAKYNMAPFSVDDRKRPGTDRRSQEISKVMVNALEPMLFLEDFPKSVVDVFVEVIQADGSTRVTGINAASLALAIAGVPMRNMVSSCSVGKIEDELVADLNGKEDNYGTADLAIAMATETREVTLLQMDGAVSKEELLSLLATAEGACKKIFEKQQDALRSIYKE